MFSRPGPVEQSCATNSAHPRPLRSQPRQLAGKPFDHGTNKSRLASHHHLKRSRAIPKHPRLKRRKPRKRQTIRICLREDKPSRRSLASDSGLPRPALSPSVPPPPLSPSNCNQRAAPPYLQHFHTQNNHFHSPDHSFSITYIIFRPSRPRHYSARSPIDTLARCRQIFI